MKRFMIYNLHMRFSRKNIIIIFLVLTILICIWVWFFFFRWATQDTATPPRIEEPQKSESADDMRIRHMDLTKKMFDTAVAQGRKIPLPANAVEIYFWTTPLVYQGETSEFFYDAIGLNLLVDPVTQKPYSYALSHDGTRYQFYAALDDVQRGNYPTDTVVYSVGETDLFAQDEKGGVIALQKTQSPTVDLSDFKMRKTLGLDIFGSCREILVLKNLSVTPKSGAYTIDIDGRETKVYCDMQTDGGGWTLFYANNGYAESPIAKSFVEMRETMSTEPVLDLSNYDDKYLAGLLDYSHFTAWGSAELLIRNRGSADQKKWVKFIFSNSRTLDWALWPLVLWKTDEGCINLPRRDTWSIINNDQTLVYQDLRQMMNHRGTSWGVSHDKYSCNGFDVGKNAHIGFYHAQLSDFENRNRSNDGVWGEWGAWGEYRYFIR